MMLQCPVCISREDMDCRGKYNKGEESMNGREMEIFRGIFIGNGFFEQIDPDLDAKDILKSYEDLELPEAIERLTSRIIRGLEQQERGRGNIERIN